MTIRSPCRTSADFDFLMGSQPDLQRVNSVFAESLDTISIRLLRFSRPENGVFVGQLETFQLAHAPSFYTASYVWGEGTFGKTTIHLDGGSLPVLDSLVPFLDMVTNHADFDAKRWWWIDSLCINLADESEREKQIRIMAQIFKKARRAIIWLGEMIEDGSDCTGAIDFLLHLANLSAPEALYNEQSHAQRALVEDAHFKEKSDSITNLFSRPWWTRVWTLQEYVLPREARLYCGASGISRGKLKSAVYSIFLCSTLGTEYDHELVPRKIFDGAFNRRRIHQWYSKQSSRGMSLVSILAYLGNHSASDPRDRIFSVLGLISARDRALVGNPEYKSSIKILYAKTVRSFWREYGSLDIICFATLFSRYSASTDSGSEAAVPSWVPDWRARVDFASPVPLMVSQSANEYIGNFRPIRSTVWKANYDAPGSRLKDQADVCFSDDLGKMWCNGVIVDIIQRLGGLDSQELRCDGFVCVQEGHQMIQGDESQEDVYSRTDCTPQERVEMIARTLVLDRQDKYLCFHAPVRHVADFLNLCRACIAKEPVDWSFETWFDVNRNLLVDRGTLEDLVNKISCQTQSFVPPLQRLPTWSRKHDRNHDYNDSSNDNNNNYNDDDGGGSNNHSASAEDDQQQQQQHEQQQLNADHDDLDNFLSRFDDTTRKKARRLFITRQGIIGMAPCRARPGDALVILFGCHIPLVLRHRRGHAEGWQVIGEGYAHGFMNGEVADLVQSGERERQRFELD